MNGQPMARELIERLDRLDEDQLDDYFEHLARDLDPAPREVLRCAQAYAEQPGPATLLALSQAVESPRQELLRRLNRTPGGTASILRLRRALLHRLAERPGWQSIEADLLHLLSSWFNPGFLRLERVDWQSPAQLLEKLILHEAVHEIDGWDDLRRRLQPDRRCFAFFHPQLPDEPLIFVEVALLPEMPAEVAPLIDKASTPLPPEQFRCAAFYSISNCERGLRGVSLGNFLIKQVAERLQKELPGLRSFCTLSPIPGFASWLRGGPDLAALPAPKAQAARLAAAHSTLLAACDGDLGALQGAPGLARLDEPAQAALLALAAAYLLHVSPTPHGDPVARFHLDNGARFERLNPRANLAPKGLRQSFGLMVNYRYDLSRIEASHTQFRRGEVAHSRAVAALV
ncbi:MAG: malonyl-CoA decarboxylase family protein [Burkholderiales bacterium]|nr:malonyl-CoA decarboxylase family protein [Burkholderiales bacterium]